MALNAATIEAVVKLGREGGSTRGIARDLRLAQRTVRKHLAAVGLRSKADPDVYQGRDFHSLASLPKLPTQHAPGTAGKVEVMRERASARTLLFHPQDATMPGDDPFGSTKDIELAIARLEAELGDVEDLDQGDGQDGAGTGACTGEDVPNAD
jgi:hypothetical protein